MPITTEQIEKMLEQAVFDSVVECPKCGAPMEPDAEKCYNCNTKNALILNGFI